MAETLAQETKGLRHAILEAMKTTFAGIDEPDWPIKFSVVELGPLGDEDQRKRYSLGIVPGPERYKHIFPFIERTLQVGIEFRVTVNRGDEKPGDLAERLLTMIERIILLNQTWGGIAIDTNLSNNEVDIQTYADKSAQGVLFVEVMYRHSHESPVDPNGDP